MVPEINYFAVILATLSSMIVGSRRPGEPAVTCHEML